MAENIKLPPRIVVDASLILALLLPDEKIKLKAAELLEKYRKGKLDLISVHLLDFEVLNGIRTAVLRKRIKKEAVKRVRDNFLDLQIEKKEIDFQRAFEHSLHFSISVYDASYIALAKKRGCPLVTSDRKLFQKVKKEFKDIILIS